MAGDSSIADRAYVLGGMDYYGDFVGQQPIFAGVLIALAVVLLVACVFRSVAALSMNVMTITISLWWVMWFWLRMWPIALIAIFAATLDIVLRAPRVNHEQ